VLYETPRIACPLKQLYKLFVPFYTLPVVLEVSNTWKSLFRELMYQTC